MNFHFPWFRKPSQPLRAVVATKSENLAAQRRRNEVTLQLAVYKAVTTPEQRKTEAQAWEAQLATKKAADARRRAHDRVDQEAAFQRALAMGAFDGLKFGSPLKVGKA